MNHSERSFHYAVPAAIGVLALVALAILPLVTNNRRSAIWMNLEEISHPARRHLSDVNYLLSVQMSSLSRASATENPEYIADYREAAQARRRAMVPLKELTARLGPNVQRHYNALEAHVARWEASVERYLAADVDDAIGILRAMAAREATYANVIRDLRALDQAITAFEAQQDRRLQGLRVAETRVAIALTALAIVAAAMVLWLQWRLQKLAARLSREVRGRDEILSIVSHDLRSPLTTMSLSAQMLAGKATDETREYVSMIETTTRQMQRLIQDLLDAAKIEHTGLSINPERLDAAEAAREAIAVHTLLATEKQVDLQEDIAPDVPPVHADRDRLVQALTNLIGNAMKFTPAGGRVVVRVRRQDGAVRFEVEDTGPGIAPADLPHLFEPFWQAKKTAHLGAGLGLKITRGIVEAHGGEIGATNVASGGACVSFTIPAAS